MDQFARLERCAAAAPQAGEGTDAFDVTEAYISYNAAVGKGLEAQT